MLGEYVPVLNWEEVKALMVSYPKPAIKAVVTETTPDGVRSAMVLHDGREGWVIDDERRVEATFNPESTLLAGSDELTVIRSGRTSANVWVKSLFQGRLIVGLAESTGSAVETDTIAGTDCVVFDVRNIDQGTSDGLRFWVDACSGIVLRIESSDGSRSVSVSDLVLGVSP